MCLMRKGQEIIDESFDVVKLLLSVRKLNHFVYKHSKEWKQMEIDHVIPIDEAKIVIHHHQGNVFEDFSMTETMIDPKLTIYEQNSAAAELSKV